MTSHNLRKIIGARIMEARKALGFKTREPFALKINMPMPTLSDYERGNRMPGADSIALLVSGGINSNWLLTGEGDMLIKRPSLEAFNEEPRGKVAYGHSEQDYQARMGVTAKEPPAYLQDFMLIPCYDVEVSAGHGSHVDQELQTGQMAFKTNWLKQRNLQPDKCALIKARGDSMEPTIYDGDLLLVDMSINSIIDDTIYIVQTDNRLIVKRIQLALDGSLTIISDNKKYKEQTITPDQAKDVKIAGRVRWYGHEI